VVAAIGVTAADRSGVIHLGLPGEQTTRSASPSSAGASSGAGGKGSGGVGSGRDLGGAGRASNAADAAPRGISGSSPSGAKASPLVGAGAASNGGAAHNPGRPHPHEQVSAEAEGPQAEHPSGQGHEKQYPEAAGGGQETASGHKPPSEEAAGDNSAGHAVTPTRPTHPEALTPPQAEPVPKPEGRGPASTSTPLPPEEAPADPPEAAPEPPQPSPQPSLEGSSTPQRFPPGEEASGKAR
jgi:hypothetical protein